jgi:hypothetical protein
VRHVAQAKGHADHVEVAIWKGQLLGIAHQCGQGQAVVDQAERRHGRVELFNVGNMMYGEAPDVRPGRILDLPWSRLTSLRRAVLKDVISATSPVSEHPNVIVNRKITDHLRSFKKEIKGE